MSTKPYPWLCVKTIVGRFRFAIEADFELARHLSMNGEGPADAAVTYSIERYDDGDGDEVGVDDPCNEVEVTREDFLAMFEIAKHAEKGQQP